MYERVQMKTLPLVNKAADVLPAAQVCCGACRTCATTNAFAVVGVVAAAVSGSVGKFWRRNLRT
jgi:hypothetical protein